MQTYNVPASNVIMHHHVTGKVCPNPWCVSESRLSQWNNFKARLTAAGSAKSATTTVDTTITVNVKGKTGAYKAKNVNGSNYIQARAFLEALGYEVHFNAVKKRVQAGNVTLDVNTIIEGGMGYVHLREAVEFLNKYDGKSYTVGYDKGTKVITVK